MNKGNDNDIPKIRVIVRKRPISKKELIKNDTDIIEIKSTQTLIVKEMKVKVDMTKYIEEHPFTFDNVFGEDSTNENIYLETVRPMIEAAFKHNAKVTCFAYGQTGSGKTHTMMGPSPGLNGQITSPGLYLLSGFDLFNLLNTNEYQHLQVFVSFYEIYCGKLYDLLNERGVLIAREDGKGNICITNLQEKQLYSLNDLMKIIDTGLKSRTVGVTGANNDSSRSHAIIQIVLKNEGNIHGKISFIDLAGSERAQDTVDTNKQTRIDGAEINKSLLALKECIRALDQNKSHTPFRGSKLTLVLRDSFIGGNCKTLMIANVSPSSTCAENTLNTLRYADRVKELKKEKSESSYNLNNKDDLNRIMMMPRTGNTVKYAVDKNNTKTVHLNLYGNNSNQHQLKIDNKENNQNSKNNIEQKIGFLLNNNVKSSLNNSHISYIPENRKTLNPMMLSNPTLSSNFDQNIKNRQSTCNNYEFINNFQFYNQQQRQTIVPQPDAKSIQEQVNKLTQQHEILLQKILEEEDVLVNNHRQYVDSLVDSVKTHMSNISEIEQSDSDISKYIKNSENLINTEIQRLTMIKGLFSNFNKMIKEEEKLTESISSLQSKLPIQTTNDNDCFKDSSYIEDNDYFDIDI